MICLDLLTDLRTIFLILGNICIDFGKARFPFLRLLLKFLHLAASSQQIIVVTKSTTGHRTTRI